MEFFDVVFPLNLRPLTYRVPEGFTGTIAPGMLVEAEIKKSRKRGVVLGPAPVSDGGRIKRVSCVVSEGPVLSEGMLKLITWMAGYYFANEGTVLKRMFPREFFTEVKPRGETRVPEVRTPLAAYGMDEAALKAMDEIRESAEEDGYRSFLLHAPSTGFETSFIFNVIEELRNVIVLVPDRADVKLLEGAFHERFGTRLAVYHGGLSRGRRSEALRRLITGDADIVLGSRSAVFAPLEKVSLIAVLHEESFEYKEERSVSYNARDAAVMRAFLSGATVLLSSICPSVESMHNAQKGKYTLVDMASRHPRPKVRVIDMWKSRTTVSGKLRKAVEDALWHDKRAMVYVNRRGYSMLHCEECGHMEMCPKCDIPLVYYKKGKSLHCNYCGFNAAPRNTCPVCGGTSMGPAGIGLERVEEELKSLYPVGVDSRKGRNLKIITEAESGLAVGTKVLTRRTELSEGFAVAGVVDADAYRYIPDFRSTERAFQDLCYVADRVSPGGQLIIQSRQPRSKLFSTLRNFNFRRFYKDEMAQRRELGYPPYSRMVLLKVESDAEPPVGTVKSAEVLGPIQGLTKGGSKVWKILVKAPSRRELQSGVISLLKGMKGLAVTVDVDPISI